MRGAPAGGRLGTPKSAAVCGASRGWFGGRNHRLFVTQKRQLPGAQLLSLSFGIALEPLLALRFPSPPRWLSGLAKDYVRDAAHHHFQRHGEAIPQLRFSLPPLQQARAMHWPCNVQFQPPTSTTQCTRVQTIPGGAPANPFASTINGLVTFGQFAGRRCTAALACTWPSKLMPFEPTVCAVPARKCMGRERLQCKRSTATMPTFNLQTCAPSHQATPMPIPDSVPFS